MMLAIVDYGVGNLFSLQSSLQKIGEQTVVTGKKEQLQQADRIILPGVGAFGDAAIKLQNSSLVSVLQQLAKEGKPLMGICLGMQLLFEKSYEYGEHYGLGLLKGVIRPIGDVIPSNLKIPHMGWNGLLLQKQHPLFKYINENDYVYFVHSYYATDCDESVLATAEYGAPLTAAVGKNNVLGCQFHPEKSGNVGLKILQAFCEMKAGQKC
ncbi:MAG: imidazole glycerol phosphate synthase subunit HisH [Acidaminococcaceae bacterium]|nr:imidazole glycerol phosphate synthase subunit HisH [Acidaminococcaceae bacterium]